MSRRGGIGSGISLATEREDERTDRRMRKSGTDIVNQEDKDRRAEVTSLPTGEERKHKEDWIGRQLRRVFDDALSEPLPDDIMSLLERIDEEPPANGGTEKGTS